MTRQFHRLRREAFDGEVDPAAPALDPGAVAALAALEEGLAAGAAILLLTGEPGVGKTTLARVLAARAAPAGVRGVVVHHPQLGFGDLLALIGAEIGLPDARAQSTFERLRSVQAALVRALERGGRVLLVIDEAQALPDETLEALRLLATLEAGPRARPLQILLCGQPELEARLARRRWSAVEQRIGARARLAPMPMGQARAWLETRLAQAEPAVPGDVFTRPALDAVARRGGGRPRTMERLARAALADAAARRERPVRRGTVLRAAAAASPSEGGGRWIGLAAGAVAAAGLLVVATGWRLREDARIETAQQSRGAAVIAATAPPVRQAPLRAAMALAPAAPESAAPVPPPASLRAAPLAPLPRMRSALR